MATPPPRLEIAVRTMRGDAQRVWLAPGAPLRELRTAAAAALGLEAGGAITLISRGVILEHDDASVQDAGLALHPSVIVVNVKPRPPTSPNPPPRPSPQSPTLVATHAAPASTRVAAQAEENAVPMCRICYGTEERRFDPLIAPCACDGTMRHVHVQCLAEWRLRAVGTRSYGRCDQCRVAYHVQPTRLAPLLRSRALRHALSLLAVCALVGVGACLPLELEGRFFMLVRFRPWRWLLRRAWALRLLRGMLVTAAAGLGLHAHRLLRADVFSRDACLRCLMLSVAANGPRIFRVFAVVGVLHYLGFVYVHAQQAMKQAMLLHGEVLVARTAPRHAHAAPPPQL